MLATVGLQRVESGLSRDTLSAAEVAEFLDQAQSSRSPGTAMGDTEEALPHLSPTMTVQTVELDQIVDEATTPGLPRHYVVHRPKTEFQATRQADRV